jgi:hypothetical protein
MNEIMEKKCTKCGIVKPLSEFYPNIFNKKDGRRYRCKQCELTPPTSYKVITERLCKKCGKVKPISEFPAFRLSSTGHNSTCRECMHMTNGKNNLLYFSINTAERLAEMEARWFQNL